jgi:hypothetical protein
MILFMLRFSLKARKKKISPTEVKINEKLFVISNDYGIKVLSHPYTTIRTRQKRAFMRGDKVAV